MIVATAGHIDHGKTSLVHALTGVDADRLPEEKRRGMTIDLGFAYQAIAEGTMLGFVDVPGHERFVRNMLAGVSGIDLALLVVAADDGPMPQTIEHLAILHLLGVERGAVALTKVDRVTDLRLREAEAEVRAELAGTPLAESRVFPVSSVTGAGIPELRRFLHRAAAETPRRSVHGLFRLSIDRSFSLPGAGLVVTGTILSGRVRVGDELVLSPLGVPVRVRGIHADNVETHVGQVGQRCAVNIAGQGVHRSIVHRGDVLLDPSLHQPTTRLDALVRLLPGEGKALRERTPVHLHVGAADVTGRLVPLESATLARGEAGLVQIVLDRQVSTLHGDRFVLRDQSARETIGGGTVVDPFPPARGRKTAARLQALSAHSTSEPAAALERLLAVTPDGVDLALFCRARNLGPAEQAGVWRKVALVRAGEGALPHAFSLEAWQRLRDEVVRAVSEWHKANPDSPGMDAERLRRRLSVRLSPSVAASLVQSLIADRALARSGPLLHMPGHAASFVGPDAPLWSAIAEMLLEEGLRPPRVREIAERLGVDHRKIEAILRRAVGMGFVFRVADNRYFPPETVRELARIAEELAEESPEGDFTAAAYKERTGIGRNVAIQLLEFFDARGLTRRQGDVRRIVRPGAEVFGAATDEESEAPIS